MVGEKNPSSIDSVFSIIQRYRAMVLKLWLRDPWGSQDPFESF